MVRVLIADDEASQRMVLREALEARGFDVREASSGEEALSMQGRDPADLVLLDVRMPGMGGMEALRGLKKDNPGLPVILMTAFADIQTAVRALKDGALDYLVKPLDLEELGEAVESALSPEPPSPEEEGIPLPEAFARLGLVAQSPAMRSLLAETARVAPAETTVLLTGESGTGKELLAEGIHALSPRAEETLLKLNCAALPENLVESELFGHERGAFTGADRAREGKFVLATRGSLFLDEVGELTPAVQAKLLRVLQDGKVTPVGAKREIQTRARIIAATNRDLSVLVAEGFFREDLFYRLTAFPLKIPPLRERRADILPLADTFLRKFAARMGKPLRGFSPRAVARILSYPWPGNVRELMNVVERGVILTRGDLLGEEDLPPTLRAGPREPHPEKGSPSLRGGLSLREMERILIEGTLAEAEGNRTRAARALGITRKTLLAKIRDYGLTG